LKWGQDPLGPDREPGSERPGKEQWENWQKNPDLTPDEGCAWLLGTTRKAVW